MPKIATALYGDLALLPLQAERPVDEELEWLSDLMPTEDGAGETALQIRTYPRQRYTYKLPQQGAQFASAFNTAYGGIRKLWGVPLWTEAQYVGTIVAGATSITCNVTDYDLRANSLALLYVSDTKYQVVQIATLGTGLVNLSAPANAFIGAYIIPLRVGYISGNIQTQTNGYGGSFQMAFDIEDVMPLTPAAPAQYLGNDIYFTPGLLDNGRVSRPIEMREDIVDTDLGKVDRSTPWANARYGSPYKSITTNAAEMRALKNFLYRRAGCFRRFWLPTFEQNLRPASVGTVTTTLRIEADGFNDYTYRPHIAIEDVAGNWYARAVSNPTAVIGNRIDLTLSSALGIDASRINRISYLGLHRLDSDKAQISWIGNGVAETFISVLELQP